MRVLLILLVLSIMLHADQRPVTLMKIDGAIGPSSSRYLDNGLVYARKSEAAFVLIELDTPGGLVTSTRQMIKSILSSRMPVVIYVSPKGAHAASAGTFLVYAAAVAAMAPGTNIGAATPIGLMPGQETNGSAIPARKAKNDIKAYIRSLAELNERNATWGVSAVEAASSLSAREALQRGVIDIIAENTDALLGKLDGHSARVGGKTVVLHTSDVYLDPYEADWKTRFLSVITNPSIAFVLLMLALYGIFFELLSPGGIFPGVIGVIAGVIALYALNLLPFNYAGLLLVLLGVAFMIAEIFVSGFGILGLGGAVALAFGALLLFDAQTLGTDISLPLIAAMTIVSLLFFTLVVRALLSSRAQPLTSGADEMIGMEAEVLEVVPEGYWVRCHGERWFARCDGAALRAGARAKVVSLSGLTLYLQPFKE